MIKTTNRVLSFILSVVILLSAVSVFVLPVSAQADDYDTAFESAFIINKNWTDDELAGTADLTIVFRGETKTVNPTTHKLFNSYEAAYAVAYADGNVTAENYFTYMPTFVFGPGDYSADGQIHLPAPARVWGAQAGISPNADVAKEDRTIDYLEANSGWTANDARVADNETTLGKISLTTRKYNETDGVWNTQALDGDEAKWQYYLDKALAADPTATVDFYVDGITIGGLIDITTTDVGQTYTYNGESCAPVTKGRSSTIYVSNVLNALTADLFQAWNTTYFYQDLVVENFRLTSNITSLGQRFFNKITFKDSYFTGYSTNGFLFTPWVGATSSIRYSDATLDLTDCVFYSGSNMPFYLNSDYFNLSQKKFTLNITGSVLYNAGSASWGYFRIDNYNVQNLSNTNYKYATDRTITYNVTDNLIYHDKTSNTLFNGNNKYVTQGKTNIIFNRNRVISSTLAAIPPNSAYYLTTTGTCDSTSYTYQPGNEILNYDFSDNFYAASADAVGEMITFTSTGAPKESFDVCTWESGWNWTDSSYYYDYDLNYHSDGTTLVSLDAGTDNEVTVGDSSVSVEMYNTDAVIDASSFAYEDDADIKTVISTTQTFDSTVDSIDLSTIDTAAVYYVKAYYDVSGLETLSERTYKLTLRRADYENFNDALNAGNIKIGDKTLSADNTVVVLPSGAATVTVDGTEVYNAYFAGKYYEFTVDSSTVYTYASGTVSYLQYGATSATSHTSIDIARFEEKCTNGNVILLGGTYSHQLIFTYPVTVYGANAGIDPVDKSAATAQNGYECGLSSSWNTTYETVLSNTNRIMADFEGDAVVDGIVLARRLWDDWRWGSTGALNVKFTNIVIDSSTSSGNFFNLNNQRARNGNADTLLSDEALGLTYSDSFTLENCYVRQLLENQLISDVICANLTINNLYIDYSACGKPRDVLGFFKTGINNKNYNITVENSVFTNGTNTYALFQYQGFEKHPSQMIDDSYSINIKFNNNKVYNSGGAVGQGILYLATGHMSTLEVKDNIFIDTVGGALEFINYHGSCATGAGNQLTGNIDISENSFAGFDESTVANDLGMGVDNPVFENCFVSSSYTSVSTPLAFTGKYVNAMGNSNWYLDFDRTAVASDYFIKDITSQVATISGIEVDNIGAQISFKMSEGTTDALTILLANADAVGYFATDNAGVNKVDSVSYDDIENSAASYYYIVELDGRVRAYKAKISVREPEPFYDTYFDNGYFTSDAVIVTESAADKSIGEEILEEWDGITYKFYVGINAYATFDEATVSDEETVEILLASYSGNEDGDIVINRSMKVFAPNYNVNPVNSDGYGTKSASYGADWGYNTGFDEHKNDVNIKNVSIQQDAVGAVELYGFTVTGRVLDSYRKINEVDEYGEIVVDNGIDLKLVNTLFTFKDVGNKVYLFFHLYSQHGINGHAHQYGNSTMLVKDCYFAENTTGNCPRLMGEHIPAHTTFDGIYLDFAASNIEAMYLKRAAQDMSLTFKNSYLANGGSSSQMLYGYSYDSNGDDLIDNTNDEATWELQPIRDGWKNVLTYDNNIFDGYYAHKNSKNTTALMMIDVPGFSEIKFTNNYVVRNEVASSLQLFWATGEIPTDEGTDTKITVASNIFNGLSLGVDYSYSGTTRIPTYEWTVLDNFVITEPVADVRADGVIGIRYSVLNYDPLTVYDSTENGIVKDYSFRLDADRTLSTAVIHDFAFSDACTVSDKTVTLDIADANGNCTYDENGCTYTFDISDIIKENKYHNVFKVVTADGTYNIDSPFSVTYTNYTAEDFEFELAVTSPDNSTVTENYALNIINHDIECVKGTSATCTENGVSDYFKCVDCGMLFEDEYCSEEITELDTWLAGEGVIAAYGHSGTEYEAKEATCTESGHNAYVICSECGVSTYAEIAALGHDEIAHDAKSATCTEVGYRAYVDCSRCDYTTYKEIQPTGHNIVKRAGMPTGYTYEGWKDHYYCNLCGTHYEDEAGSVVIEDFDAWKTGAGKLEKYALPEIVQTDENTATLNADGEVLRVYWGYIGTEETEYKWFADFKAECGDTFTSDFAPVDGAIYEMSKIGFYRFVLRYEDDERYKTDIVFTFEVKDIEGAAVPEISLSSDGNNAVLSIGDAEVRKLYYGYIGEENTAYTGFSRSIFTEADFAPQENDTYLLDTAGYYRFVVNYLSGDRYVDVIYTLYVENTLTENPGVPVFTSDGNAVTLDYNGCMTVNKLYVGYVGTEEVAIDNWTDYKNAAISRYCVQNPADESQYTLKNDGYYVLLVNYFDGSKNVDAYYTFKVTNQEITK